ncbi:MAG: prephenate dehydratase [Acidimicrobiales bacterium]
MPKIGFLGPAGTFTEQALRTQADLAAADTVPYVSIPDVLDAVASGELDVGFVPVENALEGTVNLTIDNLAFTHDLLIQREVVLDIEHVLMGRPGTTLDAVTAVISMPMATAQVQRFLRRRLPHAEVRAANSTVEAARLVAASDDAGLVAVGPALAATLHGLTVLTDDLSDAEGNQTRFLLVARDGIPAPTGHDKTSVVVYQRADEPGSLLSILQEFAARRINLSKIESRPTKRGGLGDYCFVLDVDGHLAGELLADALRDLHAKQGGVKFLGSYPAAGAHAASAREHADTRWREADDWLQALRGRIG